MRTCIGCRREDEPERMLRLVLDDSGEVGVDLAGRAFGRGAWVHPRPECIEQGPRGLERSFRRSVRASAEDLFARIRQAADRRVASLLASAKASGKLAAGTDVVRERLDAGAVRLVVVAEDARAAAAALPGEALAKSLVWGEKNQLGKAVGRGETGVVAVLEPGFAEALSVAIALSKVRSPAPTKADVLSHAPVEVR